jgi:hypothetical protein
LLQGVDGIYLTEDICKLEVLDSLPDEDKSSTFWISYINE